MSGIPKRRKAQMRKTTSNIAKERTKFPALLEFLGRKRMVKRFPITPILVTKIKIIPTHLSNDQNCSNSFILSFNITTNSIIVDLTNQNERKKGKTCIPTLRLKDVIEII